MAGLVGEVIDVEGDDNIKVDLGGDDTAIADTFQPSGEDSPPLPGDTVAMVPGPSTGTVQTTGYDDDTEREAEPGEKRTYSRSAPGVLAASIYLQKDGSILIRDHVGGGDVVLGGGEVTAKADTASVGLSSHLTPSPFGPLGPPTPGT